MTTLDIYRTLFGPFADIESCMADYQARPMSDKDALCNALMRALDARTLVDVAVAAPFFHARIGR